MPKIACLIRNDALMTRLQEGLAGCELIRLAGDVNVLRSLESGGFDMIIVDQHGGGAVDGQLLPWLRSDTGGRQPVLVLLPDESAGMGPLALESGASDWMSQDFDALELAARVNALARGRGLQQRQPQEPVQRTIELYGFSLDRETLGFSFEGNNIALTRREFNIVWMLFAAPGAYISRETLGALMPGQDSRQAARSIELHICKLRSKMRSVPGRIRLGMSVRGRGYRLEFNRDPAMQGKQGAT